MAVRQLPPLLMAGSRYLLAGVLVYALAGHSGGWRWIRLGRAQVLSAAVVGLFLLLGGNGLVTLAELRVPSGIAALVIATVPLWMALLSRRLGSAPGPGALGWVGVLIGLVGVGVLVDPSSHAHLSWLPTVGLLLAAILWAVGSLYARTAPLPENVLLASAVEMMAGGLAMLLLGLAAGEGGQLHLGQVSGATAVAYVWLVLGGSILGFTCYAYALQRLPPATVATYAYVNPPVALVLGWTILGQGLSPAAGLAALLITAGVVLMVSGPALSRRGRRRVPSRP